MSVLITKQTMSSREIAELTGKRHDNVMRTIDTLGNAGNISLPQIEEVPNPGPGPKTITQYRVGKRDSFVIVAQLSPEFTARLVDRWQELETQVQVQPQVPAELSRMQLIQLAMEAEQERIEIEKANAALEAKVAHLEPQAESLARLELAEGSFCIRDAAKTLQVQEKFFKQFLIEHKWVYRRPMGHEILAYSERLQQGVMEHKITRGEKTDGSEWTSTQARITAKGMVRLAELLNSSEGELSLFKSWPRQHTKSH